MIFKNLNDYFYNSGMFRVNGIKQMKVTLFEEGDFIKSCFNQEYYFISVGVDES